MTQAPLRVISELDVSDASFNISNEDAMKALHQAEQHHFWHRTRNEWIARRLRVLQAEPPARVVELGCGAGCVSAHLAACGYWVVGVDGHRRLLEIACRRAPSAQFWLHDLRRGTLELPERDFDVACLFDVIEHLEAPERAICEALALVRAGGLVVGTVPALQWLWTQVDAHTGHRKSYGWRDLNEQLAQVPGAEVVETAWFNRALVPILWLQRKVVLRRVQQSGARSKANLAVPPHAVNALLASVLRVERRVFERHPACWLPGASLWFAMRKRGARADLKGAKGRS